MDSEKVFNKEEVDSFERTKKTLDHAIEKLIEIQKNAKIETHHGLSAVVLVFDPSTPEGSFIQNVGILSIQRTLLKTRIIDTDEGFIPAMITESIPSMLECFQKFATFELPDFMKKDTTVVKPIKRPPIITP